MTEQSELMWNMIIQLASINTERPWHLLAPGFCTTANDSRCVIVKSPASYAQPCASTQYRQPMQKRTYWQSIVPEHQ